jgi:PAS domain S-box-containing protein
MIRRSVEESQLTEVETARLLLQAARYLGETLEPRRVYEHFRELLAEAIPHDGVVVSSFDADEGVIRCDYAWVDGELLDVSIFPTLTFQRSGGMQSEVIRTGRPLLTNDLAARVQDSGTYYDVEADGSMRKVPDEGDPTAQAAMMLPIKLDGRVVGVVQLMSDHDGYRADQVELAEGMVAQLAAAVRNARLHEERLRLEAAAAAAEERDQAARVLEAVGDGVVFVDDRGAIRFWNRAAERITGIPAERARGAALADLGAQWASVPAAVAPTRPHDPPRPVTLPVEAHGGELWLSFAAVRRVDGTVYAFQDQTPQRQLEESRHEIIATVSHELRTPMTAVLGAARTLLRPDIDLTGDSARQLLEMIATQAARLAEVTESVLLAGRLDRAERLVEPAPVDVAAAVGGALDALGEPPAAVRVETELEPGLTALADANRLQQVLINLLDNAVKYSPDGGRIAVRSARGRGVARIEVADEGPGIPPADLPHVFERFFRGDPSHRLAPGGTGLGLYICRGLLEQMRGSIDVASEPGRGATFVVRLPAG